MNRPLMAAAALALVLVGGCSSGGDHAGPPASPSPTSTATVPAAVTPSPSAEAGFAPKVGQPFRSGSFEITVTRVKLKVLLIDLDATAKSGGLRGYQPQNGQFIQVYVTAKNVDYKPAEMSVTSSTIIDDKGREFSSAPFMGFGVLEQHLGETQQPDTTRSGWLAFDVPGTVSGVSYVNVQPDAAYDTQNLPMPVEVTK